MIKKSLATLIVILVLIAVPISQGITTQRTSTNQASASQKAAKSKTVAITITSSPAGSGFVSVDGTQITTPETFSWTAGSTHTLYASGMISVVDNEERYELTGWSDGGSYIHTFTVPASSETVTAIYQKQFYLAVTNGINAEGGGWYNSGSTVTATSSVSSSTLALSNYQLNGNSPNLYDNFAADSQYNITDQQTSPNGLWLCDEAGYGETGVVNSGNGTNVFFLQPETPTSAGVSHAALVESTRDYANFTVNVNVDTVKQLRQNSAPNTWEASWLFFRYTNNANFYYLLWDKNDLELGKTSGSTTQIYLVTDGSYGADYSFGQWTNWQVTAVGNNIQVWLNGKEVINYTDKTMSSQLASGAICMYSEDSLSYWSDMSITPIPQAALTNLQNPVIPSTGTFTTPNIVMNSNQAVNFITSPVKSAVAAQNIAQSTALSPK